MNWPGAAGRREPAASRPGGRWWRGLGWWVDLAATYSPTSWDAVPWARRGFTAEFGMGSGGAPALSATRSIDHPTPPAAARGPRPPRHGRGEDRSAPAVRRRRAGFGKSFRHGPLYGAVVVADGGGGLSGD